MVAPSDIEPYSRDFGGMVRRHPAVVVRPSSSDDVVTVLKIASERSLPVATRGSGHSQAGQCLGHGIVLDMRGLNRVLRIGREEPLVEAEAGAQWRTIVDGTFPSRLLPRGLTHVLDTTIAGTLSVAGVGSESWRVGPQVDNVRYLDVATLNGEILRASAFENRGLFDAVRGGLGQVGVILRAGYPLRRCGDRIRSRCFIYTAADRFMQAIEKACTGQADLVFGALSRGMRERAWVLLLVLGFEYGDAGPPRDFPASEFDCDEELPAQDVPLWNQAGVPGHLFFRLHAPHPASLDADASTLHPWVEHVFPRSGAREILDALLSDRSGLLGLGTNGIIMVRRASDPAPLFATPRSDDLLWGIGMFPSVPPWFSGDAVELLSEHAIRGRAAGGKRYLSGFVQANDSTSWTEHYGDAWQFFVRAKKQFDPHDLLNSGFIAWA